VSASFFLERAFGEIRLADGNKARCRQVNNSERPFEERASRSGPVFSASHSRPPTAGFIMEGRILGAPEIRKDVDRKTGTRFPQGRMKPGSQIPRPIAPGGPDSKAAKS
jgi:hypothetical protein